MKYLVYLVASIFACSAYAMGERPSVDPACFESETLRVEIGDKKFAFPKSIIHSVQGEEVVNSLRPKSKSASKSTACQKPNDPFWRLNRVILKLSPLECSDKRDCNNKQISVTFYKQNPENDKSWILQNSDKDLESCKIKITIADDPLTNCRYVFYENIFGYSIKFDGEIYSPDDIEKTKDIIIQEINQYEIRP